MNEKLVRQRDGCPIGGSFSMVMAGICMTKCIRAVSVPVNPFSNCTWMMVFADKRRKIVIIHNALNGFHLKLKFTVENEPNRFLDSKFEFFTSQTSSQYIGHLRHHAVTRKMQYYVNSIAHTLYLIILKKRSLRLKNALYMLVFLSGLLTRCEKFSIFTF